MRAFFPPAIAMKRSKSRGSVAPPVISSAPLAGPCDGCAKALPTAAANANIIFPSVIATPAFIVEPLGSPAPLLVRHRRRPLFVGKGHLLALSSAPK
jgi:hypothetical protein